MRTAIYITTKENQAIIQTNLEKHDITILQSLIGERNFYELTQNDFKSFDSCDILLLDLQAINQKTKEEDIQVALERIRLCYDTRIIILAQQHYQIGNLFLHTLVTKLQISDIITAESPTIFNEELQKSIQIGLGFPHASKYILNDSRLITVNKNTKVVKEIYNKVKQNVSIAFCGTQSRIGTTTQAINLTKLLSQKNVKVCYIEFNNNQKVVESIFKSHKNEKNITYYEGIGKLDYKGIELYSNKANISNIIENNYEVYVYDYGSIINMSKEQEKNFFMCDIKFFVCGCKEWEEDYLFDTFERIKNNDEHINFIFNFTELNDINKNLENMGKYREHTLFSEYIPDPFSTEKTNKYFFDNILKPYLLKDELKPVKRNIFHFLTRKENKNE